MSDLWQPRFYEQNQRVYTADLEGPAELGRQTAVDETLFTPRPAASVLSQKSISSFQS